MRGWTVAPLIILIASSRATIHIPSMKSLETKLKLPITKVKSAFKQINTIPTQYAHSILIHKRRLEPQHFVANLQDPPLDHKL